MIDKTKILETVYEKLEKLPSGHYLDLRTYKRNRSVIIVKENESKFLVVQNGYSSERFTVEGDKLGKLLKTVIRREFPRSNKIRLYVMGEFQEEEALGIERKII